MAYNPQVVKAVRDILEQRHTSALNRAATLQEEWCEKIPRLREIQQELAQSVPEVTFAVLEKDAKRVEQVRQHNLDLQEERAQLLSKAGCPRRDFRPEYTCPVCEDTGYVNGQVCECHRRLLKEEACRQVSGLSPLRLTDFASFSLEYYSDAEDPALGESPRQRMAGIVQFCRDYADNFQRGADSLLFQGSTGVGKTHLSLAIARQVTEQGFFVVCGSVRALLHRMEAEHFGRAEGDTETQLMTCDLLVLDDLGMELDTSFYRTALYSILNDRLLEGHPTVISTNLNFAALRDRYGDQIVSRLTGGFQPLVCVGKDIRQQMRQKERRSGAR